MQKKEVHDVANSNIENYGSDEHRDLRREAAETEKAYKGAGEKVGVIVWRVEKFLIKHWPKEQYGKFYSGDAYIVLDTYKQKDSNKLLHNLFFWLGRNSSQDEQGVAAYKTVELDDKLRDLPVQFREVQGHESREFKKVFGGKITIMDGGIDSGFNEVSPTEYTPRLMHIKGVNTCAVEQVPLKVSSLNDGDSFVLDAGLHIWVWNGLTANPAEKRRAMQVASTLQEDRSGKPEKTILDGLEDDEKFWELLGGKPDKIGAETSDDNVTEYQVRLIRLSDNGGPNLKGKVVAKNKIKMSQLKGKDAFMIDMGHHIFLWIGAQCSKNERKLSMGYATRYLMDHKRPMYTPISLFMEGGEPDHFLRELEMDQAPSRPGGGRVKHTRTRANEGKEQEREVLEGVLKVDVHSAKDLKDVQMLGRQDPFARINFGKKKFKSLTHSDGGERAEWNTTDPFYMEFKGDEQELFVSVINDNTFKNSLIGSVSIPIPGTNQMLHAFKGEPKWYTIKARDGETDAGQVQVSVRYIPPLQIRCNSALKLRKVQSFIFGAQDPYVYFKVGKKRWSCKPHNNGGRNPVWKEGNVFKFNADMVGGSFAKSKGLVLSIEVYNDNYLKDKLIGATEVPLQDVKAWPKGKPKVVDLKTAFKYKAAGRVSFTRL